MWNEGWDTIYKDNEWGKYPCEELIRFVARNYYSVQDRKTIKILEVGSGTGANIWYLSKEGFSVYGIDGSRIGVDRSTERLKNEGLNANLYVGDVLSLPFDDSFFDCVIDNECIYANSYRDSKTINNEIYRVLKSGGLFYSKTFMTGTYGDGNGVKVAGEKNTYQEISKGALRSGYGIIRFTDEDEIYDLYSKFSIQSIDYVIRSDKNRSYDIKEWIIICKKEK